MQNATKERWGLWLFAGPGAFSQVGEGQQPPPLGDVLGDLPPHTGVLSEVMGTPTLLQQLSGEWPTRWDALGVQVNDALRTGRHLGRFIEWAHANTTNGALRALIVLGDLLPAIGEARKAIVPGNYRPPYPSKITIKTKSGSVVTAYEYTLQGTDNSYAYNGTGVPAVTTPATFASLVDYVKSDTATLVSRWINFDNASEGTPTYFMSGDLYKNPDAGTASTFPLRNSSGDLFDAAVASSDDEPQGGNPVVTKFQASYPDYVTVYADSAHSSVWPFQRKDASGNYAYNGATAPPSYSQPPFTNATFSDLIQLVTKNSNMRITFERMVGGGLVPAEYYPAWYLSATGNSVYPLKNTKDGTLFSAAGTTGGSGPQLTLRTLDAVGPVDIDTATRRIDALVAALAGERVDLIVSDTNDLTQLAAVSRLGTRQTILISSIQPGSGSTQPLVALVEALRTEHALTPEQLSAKTVDGSTGMLALRGSGARALLSVLDAIASSALVSADAPERRAVRASWTPTDGGNLAGLIAQLESVGSPHARALKVSAAAMVIAPASSTGGEIGLGCGLQLGPTTPWSRLLDQISGYANVDIVRSTLADLQSLTNTARQAAHAKPRPQPSPIHILDYTGPSSPSDDTRPAQHFARFLNRELDQCEARHVVLAVRGKWSAERPGSVCFDSWTALPITALAGRLQAALDRRGHGPLALIVFEDPELLRIENAYELRSVTRCLLTAEAGKQLPTTAWLEQRARKVIARCEEKAAEIVGKQASGSIAPLVDPWRHDVAVRLAKLLMFADADEPRPISMQGIDLRGIEALCRLFDRLCDRMLDNLDDPLVLSSIAAGKSATSLIEWINKVQMDGFYPNLAQASGVAKSLYSDWGELYNWISQSATAERESADVLWLLPGAIDDRNPAGYASRLRMRIGPNEPKDYRSLSFHGAVSLHALLTAARLLEGGGRAQWGLISLGLTLSSDAQRRRQLEALVAEPSAADYFEARGVPPLLSLAIDKDASAEGYELRLESSEAEATLLRRRSVVDLPVVERSLEGLAYVMSRSMASREGFAYLQGLGASLAEDVVNELRVALANARKRVLKSGRADAAHLALQLPRELMRYPWELMQLPNVSGDLVMLAEQFALGRQMWTDREVRRGSQHDDIRMLIIANPKTSLGPDLPAAREEGEALARLCKQMTRELAGKLEFVVDASIGETLTRNVLRQRLRSGNYDVIHFAGHGDFDAQRPDHSGWALTDGMLTVTELKNTLSSCASPPWLIYANACSVGMIDTNTPKQYHGDVHGMAEACIQAGVGAYVAPLWRVHDDSARMLGCEFYRRLLLERATIGSALQQARLATCKAWDALRGDTGLGDISWAGMVLYGNPTARIRELSR